MGRRQGALGVQRAVGHSLLKGTPDCRSITGLRRESESRPAWVLEWLLSRDLHWNPSLCHCWLEWGADVSLGCLGVFNRRSQPILRTTTALRSPMSVLACVSLSLKHLTLCADTPTLHGAQKQNAFEMII